MAEDRAYHCADLNDHREGFERRITNIYGVFLHAAYSHEAPATMNYNKQLCIFLVFLGFASSAHAAFMDCVFFDGFNGEDATAPAQWKGNVRVHNCARKTVVPAASPAVPLLTWSTSLAQTAQTFASQCVYRHSGAPNLGENISAKAPWVAAQTEAANAWASEFPGYNYSANTCAGGQQCGHYTQMVWSTTTSVGCGIANCSSGTPFGPDFPQWTFVVCNYSPPGNYVGERPY